MIYVEKLGDRLGQIIFSMECNLSVLRNHIEHRIVGPTDGHTAAEIQNGLERLKALKTDIYQLSLQPDGPKEAQAEEQTKV